MSQGFFLFDSCSFISHILLYSSYQVAKYCWSINWVLLVDCCMYRVIDCFWFLKTENVMMRILLLVVLAYIYVMCWLNVLFKCYIMSMWKISRASVKIEAYHGSGIWTYVHCRSMIPFPNDVWSRGDYWEIIQVVKAEWIFSITCNCF